MPRSRMTWAAVLTWLALFGGAGMTAGQEIPAPQGQPAGSDELSLRPGDVLRISVWPDETLSGEFVVEETGFVYLPFLGQVRAAGVSLADLRQRLRDGYREMMREPVVTITPLFRVSVLGAVARPGNYMMTPTQSLIEVIGMAGGFGRNANESEIRIVRPGEVIEMDAQRALEEGADLDALALRSGDRIVVPTSGGFSIRSFFEIVRTAAVTALLIDRLFDSGN